MEGLQERPCQLQNRGIFSFSKTQFLFRATAQALSPGSIPDGSNECGIRQPQRYQTQRGSRAMVCGDRPLRAPGDTQCCATAPGEHQVCLSSDSISAVKGTEKASLLSLEVVFSLLFLREKTADLVCPGKYVIKLQFACLGSFTLALTLKMNSHEQV